MKDCILIAASSSVHISDFGNGARGLIKDKMLIIYRIIKINIEINLNYCKINHSLTNGISLNFNFFL
jgi:hypothetical protein